MFCANAFSGGVKRDTGSGCFILGLRCDPRGCGADQVRFRTVWRVGVRPIENKAETGEHAISRIRVGTAEGVFLVYNSAMPPNTDQPSRTGRRGAGFLAYWNDFASGQSYVFDRVLHTRADLGQALLNLEMDLAVDVLAIATADAELTQAVELAVPAPEDATTWTEATRDTIRSVMGFPESDPGVTAAAGDGGGPQPICCPITDPCCVAAEAIIIVSPLPGPLLGAGPDELIEGAIQAIDCCPTGGDPGGGVINPPKINCNGSCCCCPRSRLPSVSGVVNCCPWTAHHPCSDGAFCTIDDVCDGYPGQDCNLSDDWCCGLARDCDDGDPCTTDRCDDEIDACTNEPRCVDGLLCTDDLCDPVTGACSNPPKDCDDGNVCTRDGCDPLTGCTHDPLTGRACPDDGNECTDDLCQNGQCAHPPKPDGRGCEDDGDVCTDDICQGGECTHPPGPDGTSCPDDGNVCTEDVCFGGSCTHPAHEVDPPCADDGNPRTDDICSGTTCTHPPNNDPCADDGDPCTDDECAGGSCTHPPKCTGGGPCCEGTCCASGDGCCGSACYDPATQNCCNGVVCSGTCCNGVCCAAGLGCCGGTTCCDQALCCANGVCCTQVCNECIDPGTLVILDKANAVTAVPELACIGPTITFTFDTTKISYSGCRQRDDCVETLDTETEIFWLLSKPDGTTLNGGGPIAIVVADIPGTYSVSFAVKSTGCPRCPLVSDSVDKEAEIIGIDLTETPAAYLPENTNTVQFTGTIVGSTDPDIIEFSLTNVSDFPGDAMNHGSQSDTDPDFQFQSAANPDLAIASNGLTATATSAVMSAIVVVTAYDFGARANIKARLVNMGCESEEREIPKDTDGDWLPDAYEDAQADKDSAMADTDSDGIPDGEEDDDTERPVVANAGPDSHPGARTDEGLLGDGLVAFEEYRGFFMLGTHTRTTTET